VPLHVCSVELYKARRYSVPDHCYFSLGYVTCGAIGKNNYTSSKTILRSTMDLGGHRSGVD
jgi:hypothetical protein